MKYSVTFLGIITAAALPLLGQVGFSEACSQQILGIGVPYLLTLPGLVVAWIGRIRAGGVNALGFKG